MDADEAGLQFHGGLLGPHSTSIQVDYCQQRKQTSNLTSCSLDLDTSRWLAWTCDAIDFYSVPFTVVNLEEQFHRSTHDIVSHTFLKAIDTSF